MGDPPGERDAGDDGECEDVVPLISIPPVDSSALVPFVSALPVWRTTQESHQGVRRSAARPRCQQAIRRGASTAGVGRPAGAEAASADAAPAEAAHLARKLVDVDRLRQVPGEPASASQAGPSSSGSSSAGRRGSRPSSPRPGGSWRRLSRPCPEAGGPSGSRPEDARRPVPPLPYPSSATSVRYPAASNTSRASFRFLASSSTIRTRAPPRADGSGKPSASPYPLPVPIRVVLADDHYLVREGVRGLLEAEPDIEVVAVCSDLGSLLDAVDAERAGRCRHRHPDAPGEHRRGDPGRRAIARNPPGGRGRGAQPVRDPELRARAPRSRECGSRVPPEGTAGGRRAARRRDPHRRRGRLGDRPEGRRGAGRGGRAQRGLPAQRADAARA